MTENEALHTAARRYLMDRHSDRKSLKVEFRSWGVHHDELYLSYRKDLLNAMLGAVEAIVPSDEDATVFRARIVKAGVAASDTTTHRLKLQYGGLFEATRPEREAFARAFMSWSVNESTKVETLPYRRTIMVDERAVIWSRLESRWKVGGKYWLPWTDASLDEEAIVVDAVALIKFVDVESLRKILREHNVSRVFELWEHGERRDCEIQVEQFAIASGWGERFWFSDMMDWIIYTTHEGSAALSGEWLLAAVKSVWPTWTDYLYQPPRIASPVQRTDREVTGQDPGDIQSRAGLLSASGTGKLDKMASLLDSGVDVNATGFWPGTPLHMAAARGQAGSVRLLIERGANVDALKRMGVTPLMEAVGGGHAEVVGYLVAAGADVNARAGSSEGDRRSGRTVLSIAEGSPYLVALGGGRREAIIALLRAAGAAEN